MGLRALEDEKQLLDFEKEHGLEVRSFLPVLAINLRKNGLDSAGRFRRQPVAADSIPPTPYGWIIAIDEIGMLEEVLVKHELVHLAERGDVQLALNPWRDEKLFSALCRPFSPPGFGELSPADEKNDLAETLDGQAAALTA